MKYKFCMTVKTVKYDCPGCHARNTVTVSIVSRNEKVVAHNYSCWDCTWVSYKEKDNHGRTDSSIGGRQ